MGQRAAVSQPRRILKQMLRSRWDATPLPVTTGECKFRKPLWCRRSNYSYPNSVNSLTILRASQFIQPDGQYVGGGGSKPFSNYQAPSGFSPWQLLTQPTQGGTLNPYTAYVQPVLNQQNFNSHVASRSTACRRCGGYDAPARPAWRSTAAGMDWSIPDRFQIYLQPISGRLGKRI